MHTSGIRTIIGLMWTLNWARIWAGTMLWVSDGPWGKHTWYLNTDLFGADSWSIFHWFLNFLGEKAVTRMMERKYAARQAGSHCGQSQRSWSGKSGWQRISHCESTCVIHHMALSACKGNRTESKNVYMKYFWMNVSSMVSWPKADAESGSNTMCI